MILLMYVRQTYNLSCSRGIQIYVLFPLDCVTVKRILSVDIRKLPHFFSMPVRMVAN